MYKIFGNKDNCVYMINGKVSYTKCGKHENKDIEDSLNYMETYIDCSSKPGDVLILENVGLIDKRFIDDLTGVYQMQVITCGNTMVV